MPAHGPPGSELRFEWSRSSDFLKSKFPGFFLFPFRRFPGHFFSFGKGGEVIQVVDAEVVFVETDPVPGDGYDEEGVLLLPVQVAGVSLFVADG